MALPFYDRVVQHMIVNAIGPVFEQRFYTHSYACREERDARRKQPTIPMDV